jgi:peptidoglycan/LPS O-acetylase OafA/YrhL
MAARSVEPRIGVSPEIGPLGGGGSPPLLAALTGLRAAAALLVVAYHAVPLLRSQLPGLRLIAPVARIGWVGVDVFFILSGFIMLYSHGADFSERLSPRRWLRFLGLRLARIYPAHLFVLLCLVIISVAATVLNLTVKRTGNYRGDLLQQAFLLNGWGISRHLSWNGPSWSVSSEWAAYLIFPIIAILVNNRALTTKWAGILSVGAVLSVVGFYALEGLDQATLTYRCPLPRVMLEFIGGALLARVVSERSAWQSRFSGAAADLAVALFVVIIVALGTVRVTPLLGLPIILLFMAGAAAGKGYAARFLSRHRVVRLGQLSFALYLVHDPLLVIFDGLGLRKNHGIPGVLLCAGVLIAIAICTWLLNVLVEEPSRRALKPLLVQGRGGQS